MSHDKKKKQPDKKQTPHVYGEFNQKNWVSLAEALRNPGVSVAALTTFIEQKGIKTYDQVYRVIDATDGDEQESTSKARALNLLVLFCAEDEAYHDRDPGANPSRWQEYDSPMHKFGWTKEEVPSAPKKFAKWITSSISESETNSTGTTKDTNPKDLKEQSKQITNENSGQTSYAPAVDKKIDHEKALSDLFDPVTVEALEKMFPADGKWKVWAERAKRNGLIAARKKRGMFNPYEAAMWFKDKNVARWDLARCNRVLANNLPARSRYERHLFVSDTEQFAILPPY